MNVTELRPGNYFEDEGVLYKCIDILLNKTAMKTALKLALQKRLTIGRFKTESSKILKESMDPTFAKV